MALDKALDYAVRYWPYAMGALDNCWLPLDNNLAEHGIKPFVICRKNYLFSGTPSSAEASAGMYSIAVTSKANGLNPRKYAQWLPEEMPQCHRSGRLGLPRLADAVVGIGADGNQAEAEGRRGGRQDCGL